MKDQKKNRDLGCQSGPSAKDSVIFSGGDSSKKYGADQQRLLISDLHFDKFPTPATFACWKIRFKTEVCTCSQFPTEAMQWIKEVELVESVDELRTSSSIRGISMPNFEVLEDRVVTSVALEGRCINPKPPKHDLASDLPQSTETMFLTLLPKCLSAPASALTQSTTSLSRVASTCCIWSQPWSQEIKNDLGF